nr:Protein T05C1.1 [Haemonchus contortus]
MGTPMINVTKYSVVRFISADSLPSDRAIPSGSMQFLLLLLVALSITINAKKLTCVQCWFGKCDGECEGDICTLAKHAKTNHTTIAGCKHDRVVEEGPAVCHENYGHIICACSTKDRCNDPASSLSDFKNLIRSLRWKLISSPWTAKVVVVTRKVVLVDQKARIPLSL